MFSNQYLYLLEEDEIFPLKAAMLINWFLFMLAALPNNYCNRLIKKLLFNPSTKQ